MAFSKWFLLLSIVYGSSDLVDRFLNFHESGRSVPQLKKMREFPDQITARIEKYKLEWTTLPGLLQRALLWDSGYILTSKHQLVPLRTKCKEKRGTNEIDIDLKTFETQCTSLQCGFFHRSQNCNGTDLAKISHCAIEAVEQDVARSHSSMWAQQDPDLETLPEPIVFSHGWEGPDGWLIYGIHIIPNEVAWGECTSASQLIIPCVPYNKFSSAWCSPPESKIVDKWLASIELSSSTTPDDTGITEVEEKNEETGTAIVIVFVGVGLVLIAIVVFILRIRKKRVDEQPQEDDIDTPKGGIDYTLSTSTLGSKHQTIDLEFTKSEIINPKEIEILRVLGAGSFGEVYLGKFSGAFVAVKKIHHWKAGAKDDLTREVSLAKSLRHPNIVQFLGVTRWSDGGLCSVSEFIERGDLYTVLHDSLLKLTWEVEKHTIAADTLAGLAYLHRLQPPIIHRDLKSRNILITRHFNAKLTDFGLSRTVAEDTMTITGSNLWLAPEMYRGEQYCEKADIFSFGIVLAEIDTRKLPYHDATFPSGERLNASTISYQVAFQNRRPTLSDSCPEFVQELFMQCTDADPDARPTAEEILAVFQSHFII